MKNYKQLLFDLNNAYIFFCASVYLGLFWALHFFWFPSYPSTITLENYHDMVVPVADNATKYFFITIPIMLVAITIMLFAEWKTRFRWIPILWIPGIWAPILIQQIWIENINTTFAERAVTSQAHLLELMDKWMLYNDMRWVILTIMWGVMMYYFTVKNRIEKSN